MCVETHCDRRKFNFSRERGALESQDLSSVFQWGNRSIRYSIRKKKTSLNSRSKRWRKCRCGKKRTVSISSPFFLPSPSRKRKWSIQYFRYPAILHLALLNRTHQKNTLRKKYKLDIQITKEFRSDRVREAILIIFIIKCIRSHFVRNNVKVIIYFNFFITSNN